MIRFENVYKRYPSGREALSGEWVISKPIDAEELADALGSAVMAGRVRVLAVGRSDVRTNLRRTLDELAIEHEWASTPLEAARLCATRRFEVALVDAGLPDVEAGFVATWSLDFGSWFEQSTVSIDEVEDVSRQRQRPSGLAEPTIERVSLPAGPAVRIREFDAVEDDAADSTLAESVSHVVVPDGIHDDQGRQVVLWQRVTWSEVVHGDELAEVADKCAELLVVTLDA